MTIQFIVFGKPETAGSKRAFALRRRDGSLVTRANGSPVINVTDDNAKGRDWKEAVASAARQVANGELMRGPLSLSLSFFRPRPKGHFSKATGKPNKEHGETPYPISRPDVLKLARAVEDALTGVVWVDDAQIVSEVLAKEWGEPARVEVSIQPLGDEHV